MRRVFADTYYWIALLNDRDQGHAAAGAMTQALRSATIITTQEVLAEVLTFFCEQGRPVRQIAAAFVRQIIANSAITV
jgi:predicted nucleic acid-binding protein